MLFLSISGLLIWLSGDIHPEGSLVTDSATKILSTTNGTSKASLSAGPTSGRWIPKKLLLEGCLLSTDLQEAEDQKGHRSLVSEAGVLATYPTLQLTPWDKQGHLLRKVSPATPQTAVIRAEMEMREAFRMSAEDGSLS